MARDVRIPYDFNKLEIRQFLFHLLSSAPGSPSEGQPYYNLTNHTIEFWNGTAWLTLGTLDQIDAPVADVSMGTHKLTNLGTPTTGTDAATKTYVDGLISGVSSWKTSVRVATTANGTLSSAFANGQTVDGVTLATNDRVLLKNQTSGQENGIYVVAASGSPSRTADSDSAADLIGAAVWVTEGTTNADTGWVQTVDTITLETTPLTFVQFSGAGQITAGAGLTKTVNTIDLVAGSTPGSGGPGGGLVISTDSAAIDTAVVARKFSIDVGDGSTTAIVITHNLGTLDVIVQVYVKGTAGALVECDVAHTTTNTVTLTFAVAPTSAQYRTTIIG